MAKYSRHVRSNSLPKASHPLVVTVEDELNKLWGCLASKSSSLTSNAFQDCLTSLLALYDRIDDLLHSPHTQQVLAYHREDRCIDMVLDGSLRLLDVNSSIRDFLLQMKEHVQRTESAIRRRRPSSNNDLSDEIDGYRSSRKVWNKMTHKWLRDLKKMQNENPISAEIGKDEGLVAVVSILREVEVVSISVCESMLSIILGSRPLGKQGGWSLVSKLMHRKRIVSESQHEGVNAIETVQSAVLAITSQKSCQDHEITTVLHQIQALGRNIEVVEEGMDCICRKLIRRRVSLLNILSN